ncbi:MULTISPECIES: DUF3899 domain-containing protein [Bacillaceae]|uniref:DUF3899 domain-containing protein n=1 Tax=Bacillaceae TaxID=186817 RepID=UPI00118B1417|nr:DUF3899 domain-containing protein [Bacillus sp. S3]QCJ41765.1 DUF3899 domain-containing protein [Bacillus sp. S3]
MNFRFKRKLYILTFTQLGIIIISFIFQHEISLVSYINISFYISAALLLTASLLYTIHSGFYDVISRSINLVFSRDRDERKLEDIPRLSEMVTIDEKPLLFHGLMNGLFMMIALIAYYF